MSENLGDIMTVLKVILMFAISFSSFANINEYPVIPNPALTPGSLCDRPDYFRYPERIAYCKRDVSTSQKYHVIESYRKIGFKLDPSTRSSFKVDHYIPLCAGGSNYSDNLWPQHVSVYELTDTIDELGCKKLEQGKITQKELVKLIRFVKGNLDSVPSVIQQLKRL